MKKRITLAILALSMLQTTTTFATESLNVEVVVDYEEMLITELKEKITFPFDERLFTLYAFMNYTGYDEENGDAYHPVREMLREELSKKKIDIKEPEYYRNRTVMTMKNEKLVEEPLLYSSYIDFLHKTGIQYPSFTMTSTSIIDAIPYNNISDLGEHLYMFYSKAGIESMTTKYSVYHDAYTKEIKGQVYDSLIKIISTYNIKEIKETSIDVNLLEAYHRGLSTLSKDLYTGRTSIHVGPSDDIAKSSQTIVHEYLHQYVNPVVDQYDLNRIELQEEVMYPVEGIYNDKRSVVIESIVRVLDTLDDYELGSVEYQKEVDRLEMTGFVFAQETYDVLTGYNFTDGSLETFLQELMVNSAGSKQNMSEGTVIDQNHPINKMKFVEDDRVFTLFAFLNLTGFDGVGEFEMGPIRSMVRSKLSAMTFEGINLNYFTETNVSVEEYLNALENIGPAPEFTVHGVLNEKLSDLPLQLKSFYAQADVPLLFSLYRDAYQKVGNEYVNMSKLKLLLYDHNDFYGISFEDTESVNVTVNLLGMFDEGYATKIDKVAWIIVGDSEVDNYRNIGTLYRKYILTRLKPICDQMISEGAFTEESSVQPELNTHAYDEHGENSVAYIRENLMYAVRASMIYRNFEGAFYYEYEKRKLEGYMIVEPMCQRITELHESLSFEQMVRVIMKEAYEGKLGQ